MQEEKPSFPTFPSPQAGFANSFQKRAEFLKLTFPNGDKRVELIKDQNEAVKFWTRSDWNEWGGKQSHKKGRTQGEIPRNYRFLENERGELVSFIIYSNIKAYLRKTFSDTKKHMPEILAKSWSNVDQAFQENIKNEMSARFPILALCSASWKAHNMLLKWYSHWRSRPGAKKQGHKDGNDDKDDDDDDEDEDEDEDEDDKENQVGGSLTGATTSASRKHARQDDSQPTAAKKLKKGNRVKNPMSLNELCSFHGKFTNKYFSRAKGNRITATPRPVPNAPQNPVNNAPPAPDASPASAAPCPPPGPIPQAVALPTDDIALQLPINNAPPAPDASLASAAPRPPPRPVFKGATAASPATPGVIARPVTDMVPATDASTPRVNKSPDPTFTPPVTDASAAPAPMPTPPANDTSTTPAPAPPVNKIPDPGPAPPATGTSAAPAPQPADAAMADLAPTTTPPASEAFTLNEPFKALQALAAVASTVSSSEKTEPVGRKTKAGKVLSVPESSVTAR